VTQPQLPAAAIDLRDQRLSRCLDQGVRPICLAIAATAAHDFVAMAHGDEERAAEALWWAATMLQGHTRGLSLESVRTALAETGQPPETLWPYRATDLFPQPQEPPASCGEPPWRLAVITRVAENRKQFEREIEAHLLSGSPVIVILAVTDMFDRPVQGIVGMPSPRAASRGNHAVLAVGVQDVLDRGRHLIVRNSWGPGWGVNGDGMLPMSYLGTHGIGAAVLTDP